MSSTAIITMEKMLESLPEEIQDRIIDHLREYILDLQDEFEWNALFKRSQEKLIKAACQAKSEITAGKASSMDFDRL